MVNVNEVRRAQRVEGAEQDEVTEDTVFVIQDPGALELNLDTSHYYSSETEGTPDVFQAQAMSGGDVKRKPKHMRAYMAPSLDIRLDILIQDVPKLGKEAATKAIEEWGQLKSKITHLVFCTTSGVDMPGVDYQLITLLGLS
ncbi:hypothetical protein Q3G72_026530 [Acer saccharum]|nr:hypothetical protein Q3G72_026530 [Acer saccharum]